MSPAPDRESKRTKKNEQAELPIPNEPPGILGPNNPPGIFGPAVPEIAPTKLSFEQTPMTPGKPGSGKNDKKEEVADDKTKPEGAKEWAAELQGKSDEEKKQIIEETLKEANER
eukprot:550517-Karenia_brevis.AAC.1